MPLLQMASVVAEMLLNSSLTGARVGVEETRDHSASFVHVNSRRLQRVVKWLGTRRFWLSPETRFEMGYVWKVRSPIKRCDLEGMNCSDCIYQIEATHQRFTATHTRHDQQQSSLS
jgi:DUF1365 family protein